MIFLAIATVPVHGTTTIRADEVHKNVSDSMTCSGKRTHAADVVLGAVCSLPATALSQTGQALLGTQMAHTVSG